MFWVARRNMCFLRANVLQNPWTLRTSQKKPTNNSLNSTHCGLVLRNCHCRLRFLGCPFEMIWCARHLSGRSHWYRLKFHFFNRRVLMSIGDPSFVVRWIYQQPLQSSRSLGTSFCSSTLSWLAGKVALRCIQASILARSLLLPPSHSIVFFCKLFDEA